MEAKTCPYCKHSIPADALKCYYCREWVNRKHVFKRAFPWVIGLAFWLVIMLLMPALMDKVVFRERKYSKGIEIVSHHPSHDQEGRLYIIGTMKNASAFPWQRITTQADYFNSAGQLVDSSEDSSWETLAPGQERNFKIRFGKQQQGAEYHHYRVHITGAEDASRF